MSSVRKILLGTQTPAHKGHAIVKNSILGYFKTNSGQYIRTTYQRVVGCHLLCSIKFAIAVEIDPALQVTQNSSGDGTAHFYTRFISWNHGRHYGDAVFVVGIVRIVSISKCCWLPIQFYIYC